MTFPRWPFGGWKSLGFIFALAVWTELAVMAGESTMGTQGQERWLWAGGFFILLLPPFWLLFFRFPWVFAFFRSVHVGIINLCLLGLGSILGVLFHQEDASFPIPEGGVETLANWEEPDFPSPWPVETRIAYRNFLDFRSAHAFSAWHLASALGVRDWVGLSPGTDELDSMVEERLGILDGRLPEIHDRFGEEFAVALRRKSEDGLRARERNREIRAMETAQEDFWWTLFTWSDRLDLIRVYRSDWFAAIWGIVFFGVLSNTFRGGWRRLLRPAKWGFLITHCGILLIITGGFHGRLTEMRGILELHVGETRGYFQQWNGKDAFFRQPGAEGLETSFLVRLDDFRADYHDILEVLFLVPNQRGGGDFEFPLDRQPRERVFQGLKRAYDWGIDESGKRKAFLTVEVVEFLAQAEAEPKLTPVDWDHPSGIPLAWLEFEGNGSNGPGLEILPGRMRDPGTSHPGSGTRVRYRFVQGIAEAEAILVDATSSRLGILSGLGPDGRLVSMDAKAGSSASFHADGRPFQITVISGRPDLELTPDGAGGKQETPRSLAMELAPLRNPGIEIKIESPSGETARRWVLEDAFQNEKVRFPELKLEFKWDLWRAPARSRLTVFKFHDGSSWVGQQGSVALKPFNSGDSFQLEDGTSMRLREAKGPVKVDLDFRPVPSSDFFNTSPAAAVVRVETPEGSRLVTLSAQSGSPFQESQFHYEGPAGNSRWVVLALREDRDELPIEWRSRLTILSAHPDRGVEVRHTGQIRVNDYMQWDGFRFFQSNARPNDPGYSGVGVVFDPGMSMVLSGLWMLMLGTFGVFILRPLLTRKHRGLK